ncbi:MAG: TrpB-like pyridoxal-phosphate dependent enzyme, partial [Solirubrobacterales bacterium]
FVPPPVHSGGLRYHGMAPSLCAFVKSGMVEATAVPQQAAFEAAVQFARAEGIIPGPEPAHAIRAGVEEALDAKRAGEERVILIGVSGHGHLDMAAYTAFLAGDLEDLELSQDELDAAIERLPEAPAIA